MPAKKPVPDVQSEHEQEFWDRMVDGEVCVQHCNDCGENVYPPRLRCPDCLSSDVNYQEISGKGTVRGYTIIHRPSLPKFQDEVPIVSAIVRLPEGPSMMGHVKCDPDQITAGDEVVVDTSNLGTDDVRLTFELVE